MNKSAILYGDFGDIVCLSALTNFISNELNESFSIVTQNQYKEFFEKYSSASSVISYDPKNSQQTITAITKNNINIIFDLHNSSFNDSSWISRLELLNNVNIILSDNRVNAVKNKDKVQAIPQRIINQSQHQIQYYLERLGYDPILKNKMYNNLFIKPTDEDEYKSYCIQNKFLQGDEVIGLIPFSLRKHKQLPDESWTKLILDIQKRGHKTMLFGSESEIQNTKINGFDYTTKNISNIQDYIPYILSCQSMIGIDTGLKHLSGYLGKKIITIYGHASPNIRGILGDNELPILSNFYCSPCNNPFACAIKNNECMSHINLEKIVDNACFNYDFHPGEM